MHEPNLLTCKAQSGGGQRQGRDDGYAVCAPLAAGAFGPDIGRNKIALQSGTQAISRTFGSVPCVRRAASRSWRRTFVPGNNDSSRVEDIMDAEESRNKSLANKKHCCRIGNCKGLPLEVIDIDYRRRTKKKKDNKCPSGHTRQ